MAKRHKSKVERWCVFSHRARYGAYDEIVGSTTRREGCFRSRKKAQALIARFGPWEDDDGLRLELRSTKPKPARVKRVRHRMYRDPIPF